MTVRQPRYSKEEFARRGDEIYESQVRPQIEEGNHGRIVAIDIETGAFELADDTMTATGDFINDCLMLSLGLFGSAIAPFIVSAHGV